jgi:hypothetical protein
MRKKQQIMKAVITTTVVSLWSRKHAGHRRQVADVAVDDAKQRDDGGLVGGDGIQVAHVSLWAASRPKGQIEVGKPQSRD